MPTTKIKRAQIISAADVSSAEWITPVVPQQRWTPAQMNTK